MLGNIRPLLKPLVLGIAAPLARMRVLPNAFSVSAIPLAAGAAWAIATTHWLAAFVLTALSGLVDLLDGSVARLQNRESPFGNYLDTMLDRIVEVALYLGLAVVWPLPAVMALAFFDAGQLRQSARRFGDPDGRPGLAGDRRSGGPNRAVAARPARRELRAPTRAASRRFGRSRR